MFNPLLSRHVNIFANLTLQREALPHLQSLVIVLLRPILANVTAIVAQQPPAQQQQPPMAGKMNPGVNGGPASQQRSQDGSAPSSQPEQPELSPEEVDAARTREITAKAMTAILLLLLKWLRLSRKFTHLPCSSAAAGVDIMNL